MKERNLTRIVAALLAVLLVPLLYLMSRYSYNLFHSLADGLSIVIAACAFVVVWNSRRNVDNHYFTYIGISLLFFAFLDLLHMLGNKNMGVFPGYGNLGPTFYIASRYVLSLSLVIAPLFINRKLNTFLMFAVYSLATLLILLSVFYLKTFPACIIEGEGLTPFKVASDYIICLILLCAAGLLFINRRSFDPRVLWLLFYSIILSIGTGLMFTHYTDPFGVTNMIGHLFQIASFYLLYVAVIETSITKPQEILFRRLKQHEEKLADNVRQLDQTNAELQRDNTERKQAEEALKKSMARLDILSKTASQLLMSDNPQEIVETLCRKVMEHLDCHAFFNFLVDDDRNCLRLNAYHGISEETAHDIQFLDYGVAVCGCAARDACHIVAENIPTTLDVRTDLVRSFGIKAYAAHPLFAQGRVIGTLSFGTKSRLNFSDDELSLMKTVADQVAMAMERVRLLRLTEWRAEELERLVQERTVEVQQAYDKLMQQTREREQVEAQLRQAQKLEALGTLAGGIAHDFNNILAAIIGFAELIRDHLPKEARERRHVERVLQAGMRGRELVKQMLTFSRRAEQEKKPLRLSSIVEETVKLLRPAIPTTISIKATVTSESGVILGDPVQIQQVLMNLATNAAYAMRENGGVLDIELSDFSVGRTNGNSHGIEPGLYMKLVVRDTGSGIAPQIMEKIFDPFFTTKKTGEGTGLGLSVVMGIVKQSHGYVRAESEPGNGSAFTVYFPKIEEVPRTEEVGYEDIPTGHERILLVDDEEALVEMGEDILAELGYDVVCRTSSREALAVFRVDPSRFDLVITDQTMPEMTGVELAKEMLIIRPGIPVILTTGFSYLVNESSANAAGFKGYVMKPLTKREIARTIRKVLDE